MRKFTLIFIMVLCGVAFGAVTASAAPYFGANSALTKKIFKDYNNQNNTALTDDNLNTAAVVDSINSQRFYYEFPTPVYLDQVAANSNSSGLYIDVKFTFTDNTTTTTKLSFTSTTKTWKSADITNPAAKLIKRIDLSSGLSDVAVWEIDARIAVPPPGIPQNIKAEASEGQVILTWTPPANADNYNVYQNGVKINTDLITGTTYTATGVTSNVTHSWQVTGVNSEGESAKSTAATTYFDTKPQTPVLKSAVASDGKVVLSWDDTLRVISYNVYQNGEKINTAPITGTTYTVTGVTNNVTHTWQISGVNSPYESSLSNKLTTYWDTIPPGKPTGLTATPKPNQIILEWIANKGEVITGYYLYRDGQRMNTEPITSTLYQISSIPLIEHKFEVSAIKPNGLESPKSEPVYAASTEPPDVTPPDVPTGLRATGLDGMVRLQWNANTERNLDGYIIYRNGVRLNMTPIKTTNFNVTGGMSYGVSYRFEVAAIKTTGVESGKSEPAFAAPSRPSNAASPAVPSGLTGLLSTDALKIILSWNPNDEIDLTGYNLYVSLDGIDFQKVNAEPIPGTEYTFSGIEGNTRYYFKLSAINDSGNESKQTPAMSIKTPSRETNPDVEPTPPKLIITWQPIPGALQYLIYYQDALYAVLGANVTQYEITLADGYDPAAERQKVTVKAKFADGSIGQDPPGGAAAAKKWGFGPQDIFKNSVFLIGTLAGFVLFGLVFMLLPTLIQMIKRAAARRKEGAS